MRLEPYDRAEVAEGAGRIKLLASGKMRGAGEVRDKRM